jgi:hypothetical protein
MKRLALVTTMMLAGCATQPQYDGSSVRELRGQDTAGCEFLGVVNAEGYADSTAVALADAKASLRAGVEARGGNAVVVLDAQASMSDQWAYGATVSRGHGEAAASGEAYRCVYAETPVSTPTVTRGPVL